MRKWIDFKINMKQIKYATTNEYKIKFANNLLKRHGWEALPFKAFLVEPQSMSQEEVSQFKVKNAYEQAKSPIVTMDAGIFINALKGFPGIYTADVFKTLSNDQILRLLDGGKDRSAFIQQTLSYSDGKQVKSFTSKSEGVLVLPEEIVEGYAFDAFFKSNVTGKLMANMSEDEKGLIWGKGWNELGNFLNSLPL